MLEKTAYFIKTGAGNIIRHKIMSFASVCIVAASLILLGILSAEGLNINSFMNRLGDSREINVYVAKDMGGRSIEMLENELKGIRGIGDVRFLSREDRLSKVAAEVYGDEGYVFAGDENPLRDSFVVNVEDVGLLESICDGILAVEGIEEIVKSSDIITGIDALTSGMRNIYMWLMIIFLLISMFIISNTIKMGVDSRRDEIEIMQSVGATDGFVICPFITEAFILGAMGAAVASVIVICGYSVLIGRAGAFISSEIISFVSVGEIAAIVVPMFFVTGILIGVIASFFAVHKYLRQG